MSGPGLKPEERCNPASYVTVRDLRDGARDLVDANAGELLQWRRRDGLSPTALCIAAFLLVFRGLRGGRDGCGVQMNVDDWCELLGRKRRQVQYAFAQLAELGWVWRRRRFVDVEWEDERGRKFKRADVWGVAYLSTKGAVQLARRGETKRLVTRRGSTSRLLVQAGLVGKLLRTFGREIRAIARRFADVPGECAPSLRKTRQKLQTEKERRARRGAVSKSATDPPSRAFGPSPPGPEVAASREGRRFARELERLSAVRALTPAQAWPEQFFTGDDRTRTWLSEEFERYRPELVRRFVASATPAELLAQAHAAEAHSIALDVIERTQPTQRTRVLRERLFAEGGGGRFLELAELRKVQAAMRAAGSLPPKRRRAKKSARGSREPA